MGYLSRRPASDGIVIFSLTENAAWLQRLAHLPALVLPEGPVLVIAPHPDDETLGAGALIATLREHGLAVTVVAVTDGEHAYDTSAADCVALGVTREREQREALAVLGVEAGSIHRLHMTDSGLSAQVRVLSDHLLELAAPGMTLLAPWDGDFHPDHVACAHAAQAVAEAKGLPLISYFFWTWHRGSPELLDGLPLRRLNPSQEALAAKARALAMHRSQLQREDGEPILPDRLLGPARWPFEVYLSS